MSIDRYWAVGQSWIAADPSLRGASYVYNSSSGFMTSLMQTSTWRSLSIKVVDMDDWEVGNGVWNITGVFAIYGTTYWSQMPWFAIRAMPSGAFLAQVGTSGAMEPGKIWPVLGRYSYNVELKTQYPTTTHIETLYYAPNPYLWIHSVSWDYENFPL